MNGGAVAFLTHSKYGRDGTEITINSDSGYYTGGGSGANVTIHSLLAKNNLCNISVTKI